MILFLSFSRSVSWNIQKINSSLQIAQSSVPNPLQSLLVMIYSTRTKDISRTPEYIFWQSFDVTFRTSSERKAKTETLLTKILIFLQNYPISYADRFKYLVCKLHVLFWVLRLYVYHLFLYFVIFWPTLWRTANSKHKKKKSLLCALRIGAFA